MPLHYTYINDFVLNNFWEFNTMDKYIQYEMD